MKMVWVWLEFLLATGLLLVLLTAPAWAQQSGVPDPHGVDSRIAAYTPLSAAAVATPDRGGVLQVPTLIDDANRERREELENERLRQEIEIQRLREEILRRQLESLDR